jgi:hypothetical protein
MTNPSLATMIHDTSAALDAALVGDASAGMRGALRDNLARLRRLAFLCRRACGLARAGDTVVLVAPVGTSPDEIAGGLADEGVGRERVEVLYPTAEEWPAAYAAARQRAGVEVVS